MTNLIFCPDRRVSTIHVSNTSVLCTSSVNQKMRWLSILQSRIKEDIESSLAIRAFFDEVSDLRRRGLSVAMSDILAFISTATGDFTPTCTFLRSTAH